MGIAGHLLKRRFLEAASVESNSENIAFYICTLHYTPCTPLHTPLHTSTHLSLRPYTPLTHPYTPYTPPTHSYTSLHTPTHPTHPWVDITLVLHRFYITDDSNVWKYIPGG